MKLTVLFLGLRSQRIVELLLARKCAGDVDTTNHLTEKLLPIIKATTVGIVRCLLELCTVGRLYGTHLQI